MIPVLTIAGSDSGGGAGLQQDLKVFTILGAYGCSVVTALTAQNTLGVHGVEPVASAFVGRQLSVVLEDIHPRGIKTGMLVDAGIVEEVARQLREKARGTVLVVDPVMAAKSGHLLLAEDAIHALKSRLLPLATVLTPNLPEAEVLIGRPIKTVEDMQRAASTLLDMDSRPRAVIVKGGHLVDQDPVDVVADEAGLEVLPGVRIPLRHTHGTGCTFSAALTVAMAEGLGLRVAARKAKAFVSRAIAASEPVGQGTGPTNPLGVLADNLARYPVLASLEAAWARLAALPCSTLVPEVQMNIGYALPFATTIRDVAAFPGRIVAVGDGVARVSGPAFGASSHVARIILTAMAHDRRYRAAMNIRHDARSIERANDLGYTVAGFSRQDEPEESKVREGSTLVWGVRHVIERLGKVPDVIHDPGDMGKEPMIRVLGTEPLEVVRKVLRIARFSK